jgi:hypothetical protein
MIRRILVLGAVLGAFALACSDISSPSRGDTYEWRLFVPLGAGGLDTLSFHWPRSALPVKIWVENAGGLPDDVRHGIDLWKGAFLYGEWDATVVSDSSTADVIVHYTDTPPPGPPAIRLASRLLPECVGATEIDTVATRFQLKLPVEMFVNAIVPANDPNLPRCLRVTAAHELGHSLGIFQHSPTPTDLMYSSPSVDGPSLPDAHTAEALSHFPPAMMPVRP